MYVSGMKKDSFENFRPSNPKGPTSMMVVILMFTEAFRLILFFIRRLWDNATSLTRMGCEKTMISNEMHSRGRNESDKSIRKIKIPEPKLGDASAIGYLKHLD
jgi:hypothetical protein